VAAEGPAAARRDAPLLAHALHRSVAARRRVARRAERRADARRAERCADARCVAMYACC